MRLVQSGVHLVSMMGCVKRVVFYGEDWCRGPRIFVIVVNNNVGNIISLKIGLACLTDYHATVVCVSHWSSSVNNGWNKVMLIVGKPTYNYYCMDNYRALYSKNMVAENYLQ